MSDTPTTAEAWRLIDPSFRGAILAMLRADLARGVSNLANYTDCCPGDEDVRTFATRQARLCDAYAVAVRILQEAAK